MAPGRPLCFIISLAVCFGAGYLASLYALPLIPLWFSSLNKPDFIPPDPFFLPTGIIMYLLLSLSLFFIWTSEGNRKDTTLCLYLFIAGLILNVLWFYVFFGLQSPLMAFMVMVMLLAVLASTIFQSFRVSIVACVLLVPYLIICLILAIANYSIYLMNPGIPLLVL